MNTIREVDNRWPQKPAGAFFHWGTPGEPIAVHFHLNIVDLLEREAIQTGPKGMAGILLGRIEKGQRPTLIVEDRLPIPVPIQRSASDSPFGERQIWEPLTNRWRLGPQKRITMLGFYRSCVGGQKNLDGHDLAMLNANPSDFEQLFLLIDPHVDRPSGGVLFMARDGEVPWKWNEVPFHRGELVKNGSAPPLGPRLATPAIQARELDADDHRPVATEDNRPLRWVLGCALAAAILLTAMISVRGGHLFNPSSNTSEITDKSALGLKTQRFGTDLKISWDRGAPSFVNAASGHLLITDGIVHKSVDLDLNELRSGSITYSPVSDDVALRLDVLDGNAATTATESVRVISGLPPALPDHEQVLGAAPNLPPRPVQAPPLASKPSTEMGRPSSRSNTGEPATSSLPAESASPVLNNPAALHNATEESKREEPSVTSGSETTMPQVGSGATAPGPSEPAELFANYYSPSKEPGTVPDPAVGKRDGHLYPAQLISGQLPGYPAMAKQNRVSGVVKIDFRVEADGTVRNITKVTGPVVLRAAAIAAVKTRIYTPARLNGAPVGSDERVEYIFKLD